MYCKFYNTFIFGIFFENKFSKSSTPLQEDPRDPCEIEFSIKSRRTLN